MNLRLLGQVPVAMMPEPLGENSCVPPYSVVSIRAPISGTQQITMVRLASRLAARLGAIATLATTAACMTVGGVTSGALDSSTLRSNAAAPPRGELMCAGCNAPVPMPSEITRAVENRIADLKALGGDCSRYGTVLESSYRSGRITIRPYMWRVGSQLASGEAKPNGDMTLAMEIDSLNVGVRTVKDVVWSMEHEAVHIAFDLASGIEASEDKADQYVRACRVVIGFSRASRDRLRVTNHRRRSIAIAAIALFAPIGLLRSQGAPAPTVRSTAALVLRALDGREHAVSSHDLARLTRHDTTVSAHEVSGRYSGVALTDVLALVNAPLGDSLRGHALTTYATVEAVDGYRVVFSLAELDARFTDRVVLLADRKDGAPLPTAEGPYRLIVPGEKRPARWARQVVRISLGRAN